MKNSSQISFGLLAAIIIPLLILAFIRTAGFTEENSLDCYYHVTVADWGPSCYMSKQFPKVTMSTWAENFSDKELGYHLLLSMVRKLKNIFNVEMKYPFNIEVLFFSYLVITLFVFVLWYFKVKNIWTYSLLFVMISPFFTNRLLMLRPHNLSISLMLVSLPVLIKTREKKQLWMVFVLGFITSWSYSNPHFILLPALAVCGARFFKIKEDRKFFCIVPLVVLSGLVVGYIIHPQFPNTFINWKIQCIDVVSQAIFKHYPVVIGNEFQRPGWSWILKNSGPYILFFFGLYLIIRTLPKKNNICNELKDLPVVVIASGLISIITLLGVFAGIRAMEYAVPFSIVFLALTFKYYFEKNSNLPRPFSSPNIPKYTRMLVAVLAFSFLVYHTFNYSRTRGFKPVDHFGEWIRNSDIPENTVIANLIWSDFPFLLYSCPQYRYISGLDPMFSYAIHPEEMSKIENFRKIKIKLTPKEVSELTRSDYAFVRNRYKSFGNYMIKLGFVPIYEGEDGWLFDLKQYKKPN